MGTVSFHFNRLQRLYSQNLRKFFTPPRELRARWCLYELSSRILIIIHRGNSTPKSPLVSILMALYDLQLLPDCISPTFISLRLGWLLNWRNTYAVQNATYAASNVYPANRSPIPSGLYSRGSVYSLQQTNNTPPPRIVVYCTALNFINCPLNRSNAGLALSSVSLYAETRKTRSPGISDTSVANMVRYTKTDQRRVIQIIKAKIEPPWCITYSG